jgi:hypothetical protein
MVAKWGHGPRRKGSRTRGEDWVRVARDMRLVEGDAQSWVVVVGRGRTEVGDDRWGPHVGGMEVGKAVQLRRGGGWAGQLCKRPRWSRAIQLGCLLSWNMGFWVELE